MVKQKHYQRATGIWLFLLLVVVSANSAHAAAAPAPTRAAVLLPRQTDNSQVAALSAQIQSLSLASSAVSQASRLVSQTSQQLAQQVTQLSQSSQQLEQQVTALSQSIQSLQQSATSALGAVQASAISSASASLAAGIASASSSAANVIAAASSRVLSAQADATLARADASTQAQVTQGTTVSVTQAALAIVGTFIGSVVLTALGFYLVLRYRSRRHRHQNQQQQHYTHDVKHHEPPPSHAGDADEARLIGGDRESIHSRASLQSSHYSVSVVQPPPTVGLAVRGANAISLFPKAQLKAPAEIGRPGEGIGIAVGSRDNQPSWQEWLRQGTESSSDKLKRDGPQLRTNWPFSRKQVLGVGGVNAGGGAVSGRVMEPGGALPLRE